MREKKPYEKSETYYEKINLEQLMGKLNERAAQLRLDGTGYQFLELLEVWYSKFPPRDRQRRDKQKNKILDDMEKALDKAKLPSNSTFFERMMFRDKQDQITLVYADKFHDLIQQMADEHNLLFKRRIVNRGVQTGMEEDDY